MSGFLGTRFASRCASFPAGLFLLAHFLALLMSSSEGGRGTARGREMNAVLGLYDLRQGSNREVGHKHNRRLHPWSCAMQTQHNYIKQDQLFHAVLQLPVALAAVSTAVQRIMHHEFRRNPLLIPNSIDCEKFRPGEARGNPWLASAASGTSKVASPHNHRQN